MSGPVPNRSEDLARPRERKGKGDIPLTKGTMKPVTVPEPDENWHPIALMCWNSLVESGQSDFFQQSDWAYAYSILDDLSVYKQTVWRGTGDPKRSPEMLKALMTGLSNLLMTEADRRRVRIELVEPEQKNDATLHVMEGYRAALEQGDDTEEDSE